MNLNNGKPRFKYKIRRVRRIGHRSSGVGHRAPSKLGVFGAGGFQQGRTALSRLARWHRFPHDYDQWTGRTRLGRGWHRGGGGYVGATNFDGAARSDWLQISGEIDPLATSTDVVLTITKNLRAIGVVGKFVEFFGPGVKALSIADRATISNMCPEYGATVGFFPVDEVSLDYLRQTGRDAKTVNRIREYLKLSNMLRKLFLKIILTPISLTSSSVEQGSKDPSRIPLFKKCSIQNDAF